MTTTATLNLTEAQLTAVHGILNRTSYHRQNRAAQGEARRRNLDEAAARRTESMARVRELLGDAAPSWVEGDARPERDYSGVFGGRNFGAITADELVRWVEAAYERGLQDGAR